MEDYHMTSDYMWQSTTMWQQTTCIIWQLSKLPCAKRILYYGSLSWTYHTVPHPLCWCWTPVWTDCWGTPLAVYKKIKAPSGASVSCIGQRGYTTSTFFMKCFLVLCVITIVYNYTIYIHVLISYLYKCINNLKNFIISSLSEQTLDNTQNPSQPVLWWQTCSSGCSQKICSAQSSRLEHLFKNIQKTYNS